MTIRLFYAHGEFCATHPWEIIVATLTLTTCMLTMEYQHPTPPPKPPLRDCAGCLNETDYNSADIIVMTLIRCLAVLYTYYQFRNLRKIGSKYILGVAGLFIVFSSFVFTSAVINLLQIDLSDLKDTLFFFLLLIDLSKTGKLAQFALSGSNQEAKENIARGMSRLGPAMTLDTVVEILVIGVGTLSGVHRLEVLSYIACLSVLVNYLIFMTFYPACLSLMLELSKMTNNYSSTNNVKHLLSTSLTEEDHKSNPIIQRVKLIMSAGLMMVHVHSRWPSQKNSINAISSVSMEHLASLNQTENASIQNYFMRWISLSNDHIVILTLLLALLAKFVIFENKDELQEDLQREQDVTPNPVENNLSNGASHTLLEKFSYSHKNSASYTLCNSLPSKQINETIHSHANIISTRLEMSKTTDAQEESSPHHIPTFRFSLDEEDSEDEQKQYADKAIQTAPICNSDIFDNLIDEDKPAKEPRSLEECLSIYKSDLGAADLTDEEVILLVKHKHIAAYQIEKAVDNPERGVKIRRKIIGSSGKFISALQDLPYKNYDYSLVMGACCENVIGYMPIPVGYVGPLNLDNRLITVPLATTEGCLVASTNRGSRALLKNGVISRVVADGMTRGPVVRFPSLREASNAMAWMETPDNFKIIKESFDSSSRFARLIKIHIRIAGRLLFIRYVAQTGDAMGMNMLSKGTEISLKMMQTHFPSMEILSLSGNFCTDKKPAAVNWIEGRGKSVVCEAIVPGDIVTSVLKTNVPALVDVNNAKNMIGSAIAGSIGGFNAHAANLVTAVFLATGQDPAQNVGSSNCMTLMEACGRDGNDLHISCTMPSIEVGTIGGGTILSAQSACLDMLGVKGSHPTSPGENASQLARIVCAVVLAGELSLMAALTAGDLVKSHLKHNRSAVSIHGGDISSSSSNNNVNNTNNNKAPNCSYLSP